MADMIDFSQYAQAPEISEMNREQLSNYLRQVRERIARLDESEPEDMECEEYQVWGERHERLEDLVDEIQDRLEELEG